jgi:hypothetical protein
MKKHLINKYSHLIPKENKNKESVAGAESK